MLKEMDLSYVMPTYTRNYTNFVKGDNATLFDDQENNYIDFTSGIGVVSVGHGNKEVAEVIAQQAARIIHMSNLYLIEPQARLAKSLCEHYGKPIKTFFANSGAEANEGAIKIARKYGEVEGKPKRYKIITIEHSFHGRTISALKATGQSSMHNYFGPFPDGFVYAKDIASVEALLDDHTVAVMLEVVQGEGGVEAFNKEELQALQKLLKAKDILMIVDEVQTGVYRTGEFTASQKYGLEPDIITLAKGLGGGVPIGAIISNLDVLHAGDHGSTFGGNFLVTSASLKVLEILSRLYESKALETQIGYFASKVEALLKKFPHIFEKSVGLGMIRGLRLKEGVALAPLIAAAHTHGVLVLKAGRNTLRLLPPLTITTEEIDEGFKRLEDALHTC